jgi:hypothetical protein
MLGYQEMGAHQRVSEEEYLDAITSLPVRGVQGAKPRG